MKQQVADLMDLVILVILLAFCMNYGVSSVIRTSRELSAYDVSYEDKTSFTRYMLTSKAYGLNDGSMTADELILMSQVQDENMMYDRTINFCDTQNVTSLTGIDEDKYVEGAERDPDTGQFRSWNVYNVKSFFKMQSLYEEQLDEYASLAKAYVQGDPTSVSYVVIYNYKTNQYDVHRQIN